MVMSRTSAVETRIQAVSPVSNTASSSAAATSGKAVSVVMISLDSISAGSTVSFTVICSEGVGAVTASSAQVTEPPKSAPDRPSASSIFFIRIPQPSFCELLGTQQTSCQLLKQHLHLFHLYEYG